MKMESNGERVVMENVRDIRRFGSLAVSLWILIWMMASVLFVKKTNAKG